MDIKKILCSKTIKQEEMETLVKNVFSWLKRKGEIPDVSSGHLFMGMENIDFKEEILFILLKKRDYICSRNTVTFSLLCEIAKNYFTDKFWRKPEAFSQFISIYEPIGNGDIKIEDTIKDTKISPETFNEYIYIPELLRIIKESLSDRDKEVLCYRIYKELKSKENPFLNALSDDAKYQAMSRLIRKLRKLLTDEPSKSFSTNGARIFIKLAMSEICKKLVNK